MYIVTKNWYTEQVSQSQSHKGTTTLLERLLLKVARKWVSGNTYNDALSSSISSNNKGIHAILNFLGEDDTNKRSIEQTVKEYLLLLDLLHSNFVKGCISVKPTQVGLY